MMKLTKKELVFKTETITYYVSSQEKAETLTFIHPAFADHTLFIRQIEFFRQKYNIILIDMVGHGDSQMKGSQVDLSNMPKIIELILNDLSISNTHLIGVSLGSLIAQSVAYQYPNLIRSVTIVGGYSIHKTNKNIQKAQRKEMFKWFVRVVFSMASFRNYITKSSVHSDEGKALFTKAISKINRRTLMVMRGVGQLFAESNIPVSYPLLIICGEFDLDLAIEASRSLNKLEPNSTFELILNAGHCANIDNAVVFNNTLNEFLIALK